MTWLTLAPRSLRFHWRANLGVFLGAALGTAILVGALAVGDSVRFSLRALALARLGETRLALHAQSRFFRAQLAEEVAGDMRAPVAPVVLLRGTASTGEVRTGRVQIAGVDRRFWEIGGGQAPPLTGDDVVLNTRLAGRLGARAGDEVLLRIEKPSLLSGDAPLSTVEESSITLRLRVSAVAGDEAFGRFSLEANQIPPYNAFVPLERLQRAIGFPGRANVLLAGDGATADAATQSLLRRWRLADAALELRPLPGQGVMELRTDRVFLDPPAAEAALGAAPGAQGVLTYFVNEIRLGDRSTPYSSVAAVQDPRLVQGLGEEDVVLNDWLAEDLGARAGDQVTLAYFVVGPRRQLIEGSRSFRVRRVAPISGAAADRDLMPSFPGVADSENCRDWKPGIPIDLKRIRDRDELYWDRYRGTPKAFLTLKAGQNLWNNRFGNLTAVRYPIGAQPKDALEACIRQALNPASIGLFFVPVREQALAASGQSLDFGQLFLGFSFFLIAAALLLTALLFALGVEQRAEEVGVLLAVGFTPRQVQRLLLAEGAVLALAAALVGSAVGLLYTRAVILGLSTVWSEAVADSALRFHAEPLTLTVGAVCGFLVSLGSVWLVVRKQAAAPARALLAGGGESETRLLAAPPGRAGVVTASITLSGGLALVAVGLIGPHEHAAGMFFGAGALLLIAGIAVCRLLLARMERTGGERPLTVASLGVRNSLRRRARSLAAVSLLACGSFLVVSVGASRHDPHEGAERRGSGTGGFALYAESTLPVYHDLNTEAGRDLFGLDEEELAGADIVPLRVRPGDEASCLNLNRAQTPRILGVAVEAMVNRRAFTFAEMGEKVADPWSLLDRPSPDGSIPAVGDVNTVVLSLGKSLGAKVPIRDDRGNEVTLRIVGVLANSVLQGSLIVSESNFVRHFPAQGGYQVFLIDAPAERAAELSRSLGRALEDVGLDVGPAAERLAAFNTVENTYLSIFAVLGGLGLLLGTLGLGVVVFRNVLERRAELGLLRAVGFRGRAIHWLVVSEHALLLGLGLAVGVLSALVAVLPSLTSPGAGVPVGTLAVTLLAVLAGGFLWTWGAAAVAVRGPLMAALRNE